MDLPAPVISEIRPPVNLQAALESRFKPLQTTYPGMVRFARSNKSSPFLRFDHTWHLEGFEGDASGVPQRSGRFKGVVRAYKGGEATGETKAIDGFCKITHLLDAFRMIQGQYPMAQHPGLPAPGRKSAKVFSKLHDAHNQAYVDSVACYMLSKLREADYSPHFSLFYGAYLAIAKEYYFNITEDFPDIRFEKWFWQNAKKGLFRLLGFEGEQPMAADDSLLEAPEDVDLEGSTDDGGDSDDSGVSVLSDKMSIADAEAESLHSASITTASDSEESEESEGDKDQDENDGDEEDYDDESELGNEVKLFAAISEFPTMLMFLENNSGTLDSLLEERNEDGSLPEEKWAAWIFQVIAALCQIQSLWGMTHNDLHSNNILWTPTDQEYFYYKTNAGKVFRVPMYGKLFRIIDFGRAIYTHNNILCISDDYIADNEAGGQYNFGPFYDPEQSRVYPNPSFDLCRLAVSILEALYPESPVPRDNGVVLSDEVDRRQVETVSDLFNSMWTWLIDEEGRNVLWDADYSERYPGFELYRVIAHKVKNAVPREQLEKAPFSTFALPQDYMIPEGQKIYPLFC